MSDRICENQTARTKRTTAQDLHMGCAETEPFTLLNAAVETGIQRGKRLKEVGRIPSRLSEMTASVKSPQFTALQIRENAKPFRREPGRGEGQVSL